MPLTITLGNSKGGSGKSTLCTLLASAFAANGATVLIVDTDRQATAGQWMERCIAAKTASPAITLISAIGENALAKALSGEVDYDLVLIDTKGVMDPVISMAVSLSDLLLVVCHASMADVTEAKLLIDYLQKTVGRSTKVLARVVFNDVDGIDPKTPAFKNSVAWLTASRVPYVATVIRRRPIYKSFIDNGGLLSKMPGDPESVKKAIDNVNRLVAEIFTLTEKAIT